jgi:hypothetical protein
MATKIEFRFCVPVLENILLSIRAINKLPTLFIFRAGVLPRKKEPLDCEDRG